MVEIPKTGEIQMKEMRTLQTAIWPEQNSQIIKSYNQNPG